jgi:hypothetical protein
MPFFLEPTMTKALYSFLIVTLLCASAIASTDPFVGKWKLNVQQSKYPAGTCPKRMEIEISAAGQGIRYHSDATYASGRTTQALYTADYNGKQAVVMGVRGLMLPVTQKRIDSHTVVASYVRGMQVVATSRRVVSADGRLMTITTRSTDSSGKKVTSVGVYEKERR